MHNLNFLDNLILGTIVIFCFTGQILPIQHEISIRLWCYFNPKKKKLIMSKNNQPYS